MSNRGRRVNRRDRGGLLKALCGVPRSAVGFGRVLQIATRQVDADGIAEDVLARIASCNAATTFADGRDQLDLIMQIFCARRVGHRATLRHNRIGWLEKVHRRVAIGRATHFTNVVSVVPSDAVYAVDGKLVLPARHWNPGRYAVKQVYHQLIQCST